MPELFPFIPHRISERLEFKTDVRSAPGGEFRDSLKDATQILNYGFDSQKYEAAQIRALLKANILGEWYVPIYSEMTRSPAGGVLTGASVSINIKPGDYVIGGKAIAISPSTIELLDVTGYDGTTLTVASVAETHPADVMVMPVATCITPEPSSSSISYALERLSLSFLRTDSRDLGASSFPELAGIPVLEDPSVIVSPLTSSVGREMDLIASGFGTYALEKVSEYNRRRGSISFKDKDRATRWARKQFLHYLRGRDGAFFVPSWKYDLEIIALTVTSQKILKTAGLGSDAANAALVGSYVRITPQTGSPFYREVTAWATSGVQEQFTLDSNVDESVRAGDRVSILTKVRLDADMIDLNHQYVGGDDYITTLTASTIEVIA